MSLQRCLYCLSLGTITGQVNGDMLGRVHQPNAYPAAVTTAGPDWRDAASVVPPRVLCLPTHYSTDTGAHSHTHLCTTNPIVFPCLSSASQAPTNTVADTTKRGKSQGCRRSGPPGNGKGCSHTWPLPPKDSSGCLCCAWLPVSQRVRKR